MSILISGVVGVLRCSAHLTRTTKEMMQPCLIYLHIISWVALLAVQRAPDGGHPAGLGPIGFVDHLEQRRVVHRQHLQGSTCRW